MSTDSTLAAINGALDSWERGEDAARWRAGGDGPDELDPPGYGLVISDSTGITFTNCYFACAVCGEPIPGGGHRAACWPIRQVAPHPVLPVTGETDTLIVTPPSGPDGNWAVTPTAGS